MTKHFKLHYLFVVFSFVCLISCDEESPDPVIEEPEERTKYESGVLILNEGGFGKGNGSVTWYDDSVGTVEQNLFKAPDMEFAGDVAQSMTIANDTTAFLVLNNDNRVEILNPKTFEGRSTIAHTDIVSPRYVEIINNKAYISVWGPYDETFSLIDSYVLVYDLTSNTVIKKIDTDEGTENLLYNGTYLFASNFNYGGSSTLDVINPETDNVVKQIQLDAGPAGMVLDKNDKLWVITTGGFSGNGKLFRVNPGTLEVEQEISTNLELSSDLNTTPEGDHIIFSSGKSVYKISINESVSPSEPFLTSVDVIVPYAVGVNPQSGDVYVADAVDYASNGKVYVYNMDGSLKTSFNTGVAPGYFIFR